jgi:hypothetical protein
MSGGCQLVVLPWSTVAPTMRREMIAAEEIDDIVHAVRVAVAGACT